MNTFVSRALAVCALWVAVAMPSPATTTTPLLHPLFTNNMVLQRDASDPVWGWANPGTTITVTVYDQTDAVLQTKTATAASDGSWRTAIGPFSLVPGNAAYRFTVATPGSSQTVGNVLIGDVWLCSGQSNMEYTLYGNYPEGGGTRLANSTNEIAAAQAAASAPYIRQFKASHAVASTPQSTFVGGVDGGAWTVASSNARAFTAIGYFMAKQIYDSQQVPVGLLALNWGGTSIHPWVPADYLRTLADYTPAVDTLSTTTVTSSSPCAIYNAMIAPVAGLQIKGAVWYQGENEGLTLYGVPPSGGPKYQAMLKQYLAGTRAAFGQPNLPFVLVQLSTNGSNTTPVQSSTTTLFAEVREAQLNTALADPHTRLVTTVDCGFGGSNADIHPIDKQTPGKRVGQAALELAYGQPTEYRTPTFNHATAEGGTLRCYFDQVGSGLMVGLKPQGLSQNAAPSPSPVSEVGGGTLTGFSIAGADKTWFPATATIDSATNTVVVSSASVPSPLYVRYGWCDNPWNTASGTPLCNLYRRILNGSTVVDGVPVSPFRNDPAYQLSVNGGTPGGMVYTPGQVVAVAAAAAPSGQSFAFWTGDTGVLANATSPATTATLSQPFVSVRAIYQLNAAPTGLAATAGAQKATLSWNALPNATSYNLKRATGGDGPYTTIATGVATTSYTDNSTGSGTVYYYKVSATNPAGESPDSAYVNVLPLNASPVNAAWNTDAPTGDFNTTQWSIGIVPAAGGTYTVASGDSLFFGSSTTTVLNNNLGAATYGGITFNSGANAFTIGGNGFTLGGGITNNGASPQVINNGITLSNAAHAFNAAGGNIALGGAIGGATTQGVTFSGSGTTTLSGTNAFNMNGGGNNSFYAFVVGGTPSGGASTPGNLSITGAATVNGSTGTGTKFWGYLDVHGNSNLTIQSGGSLVIKTSAASGLNSGLGSNVAGTSTLTVNGGSFSLSGDSGLMLGNNRADAIGVLTVSSGTATLTAGSTTLQDVRNLVAMGRDGATGIVNLDGGTLATGRQFVRDGGGGGTLGSGVATFNFNGGVLQAQANQVSGNGWFETATTGNFQVVTTIVKAGGAKIDTNGFNTRINTSLAHDSGLGTTPDGGLAKIGTGTLALGGANTYTGGTAIDGGTLAFTGTMTGTGALAVNGTGALGGTATLPMAVTVNNGGAIAPGVGGAGTLTLSGALTLNAGAALNVELVGTGDSDKLALTGGYGADGVTTVNVSTLAGFTGVGTYPILTGATGISAANFALGTTPSGYTVKLFASGGTLSVVVSAPDAPAGLTATAGQGQVNLSWNASAGATSYAVLRSTTSGGAYAPVTGGSTTATSFTDTSVAVGTTYYYVVTATNLGGTSVHSDQVEALPLSALQSWRLSHFGTISSSGSAADTADPDGDGCSNLLEYATGDDPNVANAAATPQVSVVDGRLTLSFTRNTAAIDLTLSVLGTDDLTTPLPWTVLATSTGGAPFTAGASGATVMESGTSALRNVQVSDAYLTSNPMYPKRFMRLQVAH